MLPYIEAIAWVGLFAAGIVGGFTGYMIRHGEVASLHQQNSALHQEFMRETDLRQGAYFIEIPDVSRIVLDRPSEGFNLPPKDEVLRRVEAYNMNHPDITITAFYEGDRLGGFYVVPTRIGAGYSGMDDAIRRLSGVPLRHFR